jgi:FkbM family methyltransferase
VSDILFVLSYISNVDNAVRYWGGEKGRFFQQRLMKMGIRHVVCFAHDVDASACGIRWNDNVQSVTIEQANILSEQALQGHEAIFFISDSPEAVSTLIGKTGCLPFLLTDTGKPSFENNKFIRINSLAFLNVYFDQSLHHHLFTILRKRPYDYKTEIKQRNARIVEQIRATGGVYIFGAGFFGKYVYEECIKSNIKVYGFIDNDPRKLGTTYCNLPIVCPNDLDPYYDVIVIAAGNAMYEISQQLRQLRFEYIQNIAEFFFTNECRPQIEIFYHDDLWHNRVRYHVLFLLLADATSRAVLDTLVGFRQTLDTSLTVGICDKQNPQYFDNVVFAPSDDHLFVDGGAFDGDTALQFIQLNGIKYRGVHLFEPDPNMANIAAKNLKAYDHVFVHNLGLSDKQETLFFSQTGLMDGHLVGSNGIPVKIDSIDNVIADKITFLKLDIEGAEQGAIAGAERHIRNDEPMLAIAVYHKAKDIWAVPRQILNYNTDYNFYLRHYTQIYIDTVLYGLPSKISK